MLSRNKRRETYCYPEIGKEMSWPEKITVESFAERNARIIAELESRVSAETESQEN